MDVDAGFFSRKQGLSGRHRDEVELALDLGVAPRRLAGWEPSTVFDIDWAGDRPVRLVAHRESEFDQEQVDLLLAVRALRSEVGPHGQPLAEATDPANAPFTRRKDPGGSHYSASIVATDHAQLAMKVAQDLYYADGAHEESRDADVWVVELKPDPVLKPRG